MADPFKSNCCYSTYAFVHILLVFISVSLAKDITDESVFTEQYNSSFPLAYQNSTSALGNRRRTSRWRTSDPGSFRPTIPATTTTLSDEQHRLLSDVAQVPVTSFRSTGAVSGATIRSPQSGDVVQQPWTMRTRPRSTVDSRAAPTTLGPGWTNRMLSVGSKSQVELERAWKTDAMAITKDERETMPVSLADTTVASYSDYSKTSHEKKEDDTDYVSDYNFHEDEDEEDDDGGDNDSDEEDYDDYDDEDENDDKNEFYNYDEDYEENDNRRHQDSDGYDDSEYSDDEEEDGVESVRREYARDGNMRMPINYTDPGNRELRRLVINGKSSSHIDMSLLVIYAWLGLVVIMIAITVLIFKYKQQLSARCLKVTSSCRKVRQVIGIEEGNNLLAHPLV